jgi:hypothetical protein
MTAEQLDMIGDRVEKTLRDIAIPKPPRIAEQYAALTLAIVLLREQVCGDDVPWQRKTSVEREICELIKKRIELEEHFEATTQICDECSRRLEDGARFEDHSEVVVGA